MATERRTPRRVAWPALLRDRRGAVAIMAAALLPVLIGFAGLGVEAGLWYMIVRQDQSAADAAALAGAFEIAGGQSDITNMATLAATNPNTTNGNAFVNVSPNTITVNNPPLSGPNAGNTGMVEVILSQQQPAVFSSIYQSHVTIKTRAVAAAIGTGQTCVAAAPLAANSGTVTLNSASNLTLNGCSVSANSTSVDAVLIQGGGQIVAQSITTKGNISSNSYPPGQPAAIYGSGAVNPYASLTTGAKPACAVQPAGNSLAAGCYTGGLTLSSGSYTLAAGTYYLDQGDFTVSGTASVTGSGVTIVLTSSNAAVCPGKLSFQSTGTVTLAAQTSGPFAGVVVFQDPANFLLATPCNAAPPNPYNVWNSTAGTVDLSGVVDVSGTGFYVSGPVHSNSNCLILIAANLGFTYASGTTLTNSGCSTLGVNFRNVYTVSLQE